MAPTEEGDNRPNDALSRVRSRLHDLEGTIASGRGHEAGSADPFSPAPQAQPSQEEHAAQALSQTQPGPPSAVRGPAPGNTEAPHEPPVAPDVAQASTVEVADSARSPEADPFGPPAAPTAPSQAAPGEHPDQTQGGQFETPGQEAEKASGAPPFAQPSVPPQATPTQGAQQPATTPLREMEPPAGGHASPLAPEGAQQPAAGRDQQPQASAPPQEAPPESTQQQPAPSPSSDASESAAPLPEMEPPAAGHASSAEGPQQPAVTPGPSLDQQPQASAPPQAPPPQNTQQPTMPLPDTGPPAGGHVSQAPQGSEYEGGPSIPQNAELGDGAAPPPPLPEGSPVAAEDYDPAFAEVGDATTQGAISRSQGIPSAQDVLYAIAVSDPDAEREQSATKTLESMRQDAASGGGKKRGKQKVPLQQLPLDSLVPGTPLVATVFSPSGGVGKSSTSMNLGVYISAVAQTMAKKRASQGGNGEEVRIPRVLAIDGDIVMGSLLLRLIGDMEPSIHDLLLYLDDRERQGFKGEAAWPSVYKDPPAGEESMQSFVHWPNKLPNFNVLGAPKEPDLFWDFGPAEYRQILTMLGKFYDIIIIDAGTDLVLESQRAWLSHANEVFLITSPEIDRIYNTAKAARMIAKPRPHPQDTRENPEKLPPLATSDNISVVMTRCDADSGLDLPSTVDYFFDWLDDGQKFWIPDVSADMLQANNQGRFLVLDNPDYAKVIGAMAKRLFHRYATSRKQHSLPAA